MNQSTFNIGFSPCPNDTFIFDAMIHQKIDTEGLSFKAVLADVQTLNEWATEDKLDITKLSYGVLPLVLSSYWVLNSGSALGQGVGPLLVAASPINKEQVSSMQVAIPGEHTTAHLLFSLAFPEVKNKVFMPYDQIESFVLAGKGVGVIIHENRFTYQEKGLHKVMDLGENWESLIHTFIPLGGIVIKRNIPTELAMQVDRIIKRSIEYAWEHYPQLNDFITTHAQEMSEDVMRKHIQLYVNEYSTLLGEEGKNAVEALLKVHPKASDNKELPLFVPI